MPDNIPAMVISTLIKSQHCVKYTKSSQRLCNTRERTCLEKRRVLEISKTLFLLCSTVLSITGGKTYWNTFWILINTNTNKSPLYFCSALRLFSFFLSFFFLLFSSANLFRAHTQPLCGKMCGCIKLQMPLEWERVGWIAEESQWSGEKKRVKQINSVLTHAFMPVAGWKSKQGDAQRNVS